MQENHNDIDFVGLRKQSHLIEKLFLDMEYNPREMFNKLHGDMRLMFTGKRDGRRIDIFLDKFIMCHEFDLKDRLGLCERFLPPADLLLTKLQVVGINKKDIQDVAALLVDFPVSDKLHEIQREHIVHYTSSNWGIYKTLSVNLDKVKSVLPELALPEKESQVILGRIDEDQKGNGGLAEDSGVEDARQGWRKSKVVQASGTDLMSPETYPSDIIQLATFWE